MFISQIFIKKTLLNIHYAGHRLDKDVCSTNLLWNHSSIEKLAKDQNNPTKIVYKEVY